MIDKLIAEAGAEIRRFNPQLADCWDREPFRRATLAEAFRAGFKNPPPLCDVLDRVAYLDQRNRALLAAGG